MNTSYSLVLLATIVIGVTSGSVIMPTQDLEGSNSSTSVQIYTDVVEKSESSANDFLVTPYGYEAILSLITGKMRCYTCSSPCGGTRCCDNTGYPQCCRVNGVCGCCSRIVGRP